MAGLPEAEFWGLTPRLYAIRMYAARENMRVDIRMRNRAAWNTANLVAAAWCGKLPPFDQTFPPQGGQARKPQTPAEQEILLRALAASWGASVEPES